MVMCHAPRFRNHINLSPLPTPALSGNDTPWFKMLIFHCSDCNETINSADDESVKEVFDRLDEHIATGRGRRLLSRERRTLPGRELTIYDQSLSALRVSYGHTDDPPGLYPLFSHRNRQFLMWFFKAAGISHCRISASIAAWPIRSSVTFVAAKNSFIASSVSLLASSSALFLVSTTAPAARSTFIAAATAFKSRSIFTLDDFGV